MLAASLKSSPLSMYFWSNKVAASENRGAVIADRGPKSQSAASVNFSPSLRKR